MCNKELLLRTSIYMASLHEMKLAGPDRQGTRNVSADEIGLQIKS